MEPVRADDWKHEPMPALRASIALDRRFDAGEMQRIRLGLRPEVMEDKWFLWFEDDRLHFHRSWTGLCIFVARFEPQGDGSARLVEATVNRDPEQYRGDDDAYDAAMIVSLIDMLLLRRAGSLPTRGATDPDRAVESWGVAGRAILGDGPRPGRNS